MKKLLYLLLLVSSIGMGQTEMQVTSDVTTTAVDYITFNPLASVDFTTPRYTFGYVRTLNERWKAGIHAGYGSDAISFRFGLDDDRKNYSLFEIRPEVYYVLEQRRKATPYLSFELQYLQHKERFLDDYYLADNRYNRVEYTQADLTRNKYAATLKFGSFFDLGGKIGLNAFYGIGVRTRDNSFDRIINPTFNPDAGDDAYFSGIQDYYRKKGSVFGVNVVIGI